MSDPILERLRAADPAAGDDRLPSAEPLRALTATPRVGRVHMGARLALGAVGLAATALVVIALLPTGGGSTLVERAAAATEQPARLVHLVYTIAEQADGQQDIASHGEAWATADGGTARQTQVDAGPNGPIDKLNSRYSDGVVVFRALGKTHVALCAWQQGPGGIWLLQHQVATLLRGAAAKTAGFDSQDNGDGTTTVRGTIPGPDPTSAQDHVKAVVDNTTLLPRQVTMTATGAGTTPGWKRVVTFTTAAYVDQAAAPDGVLDPLPQTPANPKCAGPASHTPTG